MGLKLVFLVESRAMSLIRLSRRESWWKDAEILMLRHQLAVAERERPRARPVDVVGADNRVKAVDLACFSW
jgi:hypothetical protein